MPFPAIDRESARLAALHQYAILDTPAEQSYDDLTELASQLTGLPIALISLVDESRQWFKSRRGLESSETSRDIAFCAHAILSDTPLEIEDASRDPRFEDNPLVQGEEHIRQYYGVPLTSPDGHNVGTLCVMGREPGHLQQSQRSAMSALARQVVTLLEQRRIARLLADTLSRLKHLEGILPACAYCKSIRTESGQWKTLEAYLLYHSDALLSHGICPECMKEHFPEDQEIPIKPTG